MVLADVENVINPAVFVIPKMVVWPSPKHYAMFLSFIIIRSARPKISERSNSASSSFPLKGSLTAKVGTWCPERLMCHRSCIHNKSDRFKNVDFKNIFFNIKKHLPIASRIAAFSSRLSMDTSFWPLALQSFLARTQLSWLHLRKQNTHIEWLKTINNMGLKQQAL